MKKIFTILLLAVFIPPAARAQSQFAPVGAEWYHWGNDYDFWYMGSMHSLSWLDHTASVSDTSIAGMACRKLITTRYERTVDHPDIAFSDVSQFYVYDNTDTVFVYNRYWEKFIPLFVYNISEGDTITLPVPQYSGSTGEDSTFTFIVDSVRTELYDTANLKTFYTRTLYADDAAGYVNWGNTPASVGKYAQKLGGVASPAASIFPLLNSLIPDAGTQNTAPCGNLQCYNDAAYHLKFTAIPCDSFPPLALLSLNDISTNSGINIYPNPASGVVHIEREYPFAENSSLAITDISGKPLITKQYLSGKRSLVADISGLMKGLYIMQLDTEGKRYYSKLIVR